MEYKNRAIRIKAGQFTEPTTKHFGKGPTKYHHQHFNDPEKIHFINKFYKRMPHKSKHILDLRNHSKNKTFKDFEKEGRVKLSDYDKRHYYNMQHIAIKSKFKEKALNKAKK